VTEGATTQAAQPVRRRALKPNIRVLAASVALIVGLALYAAAAATLADALPENKWIEGFYLAAAGLVWVWPAVQLIRWASRRS